MPFYEYRCDACGHEFEAMQKMSDPRLTDCPECGRPELTKLVSAAAFRLKGGGWYETDFKSGSKRNVHDGDGKADAKSGDKDKSDKKPDGKSDTKPDSKAAACGTGACPACS